MNLLSNVQESPLDGISQKTESAMVQSNQNARQTVSMIQQMRSEISKFRRELVELNKRGKIDINESINKYEVGDLN